MNYEICGDSFSSYLKVFLAEGEEIYSSPGAFVSMKGHAEISIVGQGMFNTLKRKIAGSKGFYFVKYQGKKDGIEIIFSPESYGRIIPVTIKARPVIIQDVCYLAHTPEVKITTEWVGTKGLFTKSGFMWLKAESAGEKDGIVFVTSSGDFVEIECDEKGCTVDPQHIICYQAFLNMEISLFGGMASAILGKEGFIFNFKGKGKIWIQSRKFPEKEENKTQK
jgi:uncharacterized protein (TIGR00266 family)